MRLVNRPGRAITKTAGAVLCVVAVAWMLTRPVALASEGWCYGVCLGDCAVAAGTDCDWSEWDGHLCHWDCEAP